MKTILSIPRVVLVTLALGTASATATFAQSTSSTTTSSTTAPTCSGCWHHHHSVLTDAEKTELKTAHTTALANNPSLAQQLEALKVNPNATKADWKALHSQLRTAELAVDPNLTPVFDKLKAAHGHWNQSQ
jgi:hypothetical protein